VPAPVAVVRDFVNTTDHETGTDELTTTAGLAAYLAREGLLEGAARAGRDDLALAHRLRAALREALEANHDGTSADPPGLDEALAALPVRLGWADGVPTLAPTGSGVPAALARIGVAAHEAAAAGLWWRLKICRYDECEWAYYDHSKNRSRNYCEYNCGNKLKTRAYRARQKAAGPASDNTG
jgi:predicted RNA-binding Zn ribbon-like protein